MDTMLQCRIWLARVLAWARRYPLSIGIVAVAIVGVGTALLCIDPLEWRLSSAAERADRAVLRELGIALLQYAGYNKDVFPPTSLSPNFGTPDLTAMAKYLSPELVDRITSKTKPRICYLGYLVAGDLGALRLFDTWQKQGANADVRKDLVFDPAVATRMDPTKGIMRLRLGLDRFYVREIGNPAGPAQAAGLIPVLWELPRPDRPGGYVVYTNGRVEWASYPVAFPMSENTVSALRHFIEEPSAAHDLHFPSAIQEAVMAIDQANPVDVLYSFPINGPDFLQYDATPSVVVGGARGYRITVGRGASRKLALSGIEVQDFKASLDLVLTPVEEPEPDPNVIPKSPLLPSNSGPFRRLGEGHGFRWYARGGDVQFTTKGAALVRAKRTQGAAK